jgi:hypothetical protein
MRLVDEPEFSADVLALAADVLRRGDAHLRRDSQHAGLWWVVSLHNPNIYRVQVGYDDDGQSVVYITCTCTHGMNRGGDARCYHAAAALAAIGEVSLDGARAD